MTPLAWLSGPLCPRLTAERNRASGLERQLAVSRKKADDEMARRKQQQVECEDAKQLAAEKNAVVQELLADAEREAAMREKSVAYARGVLAHYNEVI